MKKLNTDCLNQKRTINASMSTLGSLSLHLDSLESPEQGVVLPTVGRFPDPVNIIRIIPHRHAYGPASLHHPSLRSPSQVILDCVEVATKTRSHSSKNHH